MQRRANALNDGLGYFLGRICLWLILSFFMNRIILDLFILTDVRILFEVIISVFQHFVVEIVYLCVQSVLNFLFNAFVFLWSIFSPLNCSPFRPCIDKLILAVEIFCSSIWSFSCFTILHFFLNGLFLHVISCFLSIVIASDWAIRMPPNNAYFKFMKRICCLLLSIVFGYLFAWVFKYSIFLESFGWTESSPRPTNMSPKTFSLVVLGCIATLVFFARTYLNEGLNNVKLPEKSRLNYSEVVSCFVTSIIRSLYAPGSSTCASLVVCAYALVANYCHIYLWWLIWPSWHSNGGLLDFYFQYYKSKPIFIHEIFSGNSYLINLFFGSCSSAVEASQGYTFTDVLVASTASIFTALSVQVTMFTLQLVVFNPMNFSTLLRYSSRASPPGTKTVAIIHLSLSPIVHYPMNSVSTHSPDYKLFSALRAH